MSLKIVPPATAEGRLALRQQGQEPRSFAQFFWTMARGLEYDDAALKEAFNLTLDDPLPRWEMEQLHVLNFWDFSTYVHHRKDWQILNPPEDISSDHPALLPPSSQVHDHLLTPTRKRRDRRKRAAQVAASASESSVLAPASESSSVLAPAYESAEPTSATPESTKTSEVVELKVSLREVSQSTSVPVSVKSVPVKSSLDNPVFLDQVNQGMGDPTTSGPGRRRGRRARARRARILCSETPHALFLKDLKLSTLPVMTMESELEEIAPPVRVMESSPKQHISPVTAMEASFEQSDLRVTVTEASSEQPAVSVIESSFEQSALSVTVTHVNPEQSTPVTIMETTPEPSVVAVRLLEAILKPPVPTSTESTPAQEPSPKSVPESLQTPAPESATDSVPAAPVGIVAAPKGATESVPAALEGVSAAPKCATETVPAAPVGIVAAPEGTPVSVPAAQEGISAAPEGAPESVPAALKGCPESAHESISAALEGISAGLKDAPELVFELIPAAQKGIPVLALEPVLDSFPVQEAVPVSFVAATEAISESPALLVKATENISEQSFCTVTREAVSEISVSPRGAISTSHVMPTELIPASCAMPTKIIPELLVVLVMSSETTLEQPAVTVPAIDCNFKQTTVIVFDTEANAEQPAFTATGSESAPVLQTLESVFESRSAPDPTLPSRSFPDSFTVPDSAPVLKPPRSTPEFTSEQVPVQAQPEIIPEPIPESVPVQKQPEPLLEFILESIPVQEPVSEIDPEPVHVPESTPEPIPIQDLPEAFTLSVSSLCQEAAPCLAPKSSELRTFPNSGVMTSELTPKSNFSPEPVSNTKAIPVPQAADSTLSYSKTSLFKPVNTPRYTTCVSPAPSSMQPNICGSQTPRGAFHSALPGHNTRSIPTLPILPTPSPVLYGCYGSAMPAPFKPAQFLPPTFPVVSPPPWTGLDARWRPLGGGYCQGSALAALSVLSLFNVCLVS
ncbi:Myosin light chain kinase 2, skeletal/cardiac muscle [Labeo rohita]|uniref:Myosin light chain kinase 2, skeletal/cardiac muscle n=1 Tax=Labeo rohita TaxID=84645 RepID=A0ABQ8LB50_LABRO|nr:Myosin light chain kinase 2, skeletal/cardiac muscle [Labeo rohita]